MPDETEHQTMHCMEVWGGNDPVDKNVQLPGLDAWVYSKPYLDGESGGDLHYVSSCATGRITRLLLADVSGHGEPMNEVTNTLRDLMRQYVNYFSQRKFVEAMNNEFTRHSTTGLFATAVVTSFFAPTRQLLLSNAGHPPPLVFRVKDKKWSWLEASRETARNPAAAGERAPSNIPFGVLDATRYDQLDTILDIGDLVVCYTDSLIESDGPDGKMLGPKGLLETLQKLDTTNPASLIPDLLKAIASLSPDNLTNDDVSVLIFQPNGQGTNVSLTGKLLSPFRILNKAARKLFTHPRQIPWPEMTLQNMGLDWFSRSSKH